tara:strand:+ start:21101 stop:21613 length:513 start_codon:yes stop_codon:yes gene_type:complete
MLGSSLRQFEKQYVSTRDEKGTWRIVDLWHKELEGVNLEDDIPDTHPAIKILTEGEFLSLIDESKRLGMMQKMEESGDFSISADAYDSVCEERDNLKMKLEELEDNPQTTQNHKRPNSSEDTSSESFQLANKKLDTLLKLSSLGTLSEDLTKAVLILGGNTDLDSNTNYD